MRYQFSVRDLLLLVVVAAAVTATIATERAIISFITLGVLLLFVWHRPIVLRFWLVLTLGLGSGLAWAMNHRANYGNILISEYGMATDEIAGWGMGMFVGGLAVAWAFLRNPPTLG